MSNPFNNLNGSQRQAVEHDGGHLLIVAGPGTGKTHTLTCRIARKAQELEEDEKLLAITFTNKAADEMKRRLKENFSLGEDKVTVGTFHSFCLTVLRKYRRDFDIISPEEVFKGSASLWPDKSASERRRLIDRIARFKSDAAELEVPEETREYSLWLKNEGVYDFDDILLQCLDLFSNYNDVMDDFHHVYRGVFVDEYQDINSVQHALLTVLVNEFCPLTAIGDPNQAIYGFRGSDVEFFNSFEEEFKDATRMSLSDNYRSSQNLLTASGQVLGGSESFMVPELTAKLYSEGHLIIHEAPTVKAEAEFVVHTIEKLIGGTSMFSQDSGRVDTEEEGEVAFGDIAVLYRMNALRAPLKEAFERSGIPYVISGEKQQDIDAESIINPVRGEEFQPQHDKVNIMTMHASKGLEFPVVFIIGCEEGIIPLELENFITQRDEERRLFYVAMTRAKNRLYLLHSKKRTLFGKTSNNPPSPFLNDIEEELKQLSKSTHQKKKKPKDEQMSLF